MDTKKNWLVIDVVNTTKKAENRLKKWRSSKFGDLEYKIEPLSNHKGFFIAVNLPPDVDTNPRYQWTIFRERAKI